MHTNKKGFTLIELLIVISLLGTLAVALLAAIDPFEQFKKGTDTGVRNTAQEFHNASIRYYAQRSGWPVQWSIAPSLQQNIVLGTPAIITSHLAPLITAGELKINFADLAGDQLNKINVAVLDSRIMVCYKPESKSFQASDKNTKFTATTFDVSGNPVSDITNSCKTNGGATDCFWCVQ